MPQFDHDGIQFNYRDEGTGQPFFFQHGLGADVTQPFGLLKPPAGIRLIAFDVRGHGLTRPLGKPSKLCFRVFGEDLAALMDHLRIERAIVGGISMGAALALHFAVRWPARVEGLVLSRPAWLEAPCPWNVKMFTLVSELIRKHGAPQGLVEFRKTSEYLEARAKWPDVANSLSSQFQNPRVEETAPKLERIIKDSPHPDRAGWAAVRVPTLVLGNRLDPVHPFEYAEELARVIPGAQFREVTSKSMNVEQHGRDVQRELDEFFEDCRALKKQALNRAMLKCSTSLWSADLTNLAADMKRVEPFTERWHLDVADGHYVKNLLFFPDLVAQLRKVSSKPFEVHLMVTDPLAWVDPFIEAGADIIIFCFDAIKNPGDVLKTIRARGKKAGVSLLITEPLDVVEPHWNELDVLCVVGTAMGIKGASMDAGVPGKIKSARAWIDQKGLKTEIEADGGIRRETVPLLKAAGADYIVPGSLMFKEDPAAMRKWLATA